MFYSQSHPFHHKSNMRYGKISINYCHKYKINVQYHKSCKIYPQIRKIHLYKQYSQQKLIHYRFSMKCGIICKYYYQLYLYIINYSHHNLHKYYLIIIDIILPHKSSIMKKALHYKLNKKNGNFYIQLNSHFHLNIIYYLSDMIHRCYHKIIQIPIYSFSNYQKIQNRFHIDYHKVNIHYSINKIHLGKKYNLNLKIHYILYKKNDICRKLCYLKNNGIDIKCNQLNDLL